VRYAAVEKALETLLTERWAALFGLTESQLLSSEAEEPHSLVLGRVALMTLSRDYFTPRVDAAVSACDRDKAFAKHLLSAWETLETRALSHLGRLNLWPVVLLLDRQDPSDELMRKNLECYRECRESPIWVTKGGDIGSWGFNVRTTSIVCSTLNAFWRHVLFIPGNRKRFEKCWPEIS
jgi:hypothetical protein